MTTIWVILGIISLVLLTIYWKNRNAVWGGLTAGIIIALIIALVFLFKGNGFNWYVLIKGAIIGTIAGVLAELLGVLGKKNK